MQGVYTVVLFAYHSKSSRIAIHCTGRYLIGSGAYPLTLALAIPLHEFLLLPILRHRTLSMLKRMGIGVVISLLGIACLFAMDLSGHVHAKESNHSTECLFYANNTAQGTHNWTSDKLISLDPRYLILPIILIALGEMQVYITGKDKVIIYCLHCTACIFHP